MAQRKANRIVKRDRVKIKVNLEEKEMFQELIDQIRPFIPAGFDKYLPDGIPCGYHVRSNKKFWARAHLAENTGSVAQYIEINPILRKEGKIQVIETVIHELAHVIGWNFYFANKNSNTVNFLSHFSGWAALTIEICHNIGNKELIEQAEKDIARYGNKKEEIETIRQTLAMKG